VKKALVGVLILLCFILVISTYSSPVILPESYPEETQPPGDIPQEVFSPQTPDVALSPDPDIKKDDPGLAETSPDHQTEDDVIIYGAGTYKTGTQIPAGLYLAVNDGSGEPVLTIKDNQTANTEMPKILVTSRYMRATGSFTSKPNYIEGVRSGGGEPVFPDDDPEFASLLREGIIEYAEALAGKYDGLLLTGGGDIAAHFFNQEQHPAANPPDEILDRAELALCRAFIRANKPVLGICRGMQVLNVAAGGELIQDIPAILGIPLNVHYGESTRHDITIRSGTWLHSLAGPETGTNSLHHQSVDGVAPGFSVAAFTGPVIEAMERGNLLGTQFHPERMLNEGMLPLFEDFIYRCSYNNIVIEYFNTHTIINIRENQFLDIKGAYLQKIGTTSGMFEPVPGTQREYTDGMYLVGTHLPKGTYRLSTTGNAILSSYAIYNDISDEIPEKSGRLFYHDTFVTLRDGQFIRLINASMVPGGPPSPLQ